MVRAMHNFKKLLIPFLALISLDQAFAEITRDPFEQIEEIDEIAPPAPNPYICVIDYLDCLWQGQMDPEQVNFCNKRFSDCLDGSIEIFPEPAPGTPEVEPEPFEAPPGAIPQDLSSNETYLEENEQYDFADIS